MLGGNQTPSITLRNLVLLSTYFHYATLESSRHVPLWRLYILINWYMNSLTLSCRKSETGGKLRACSRCSVAGKGVALYCSIQCQKEDWPRHKLDCNKNLEDGLPMPEGAKDTLEHIVIWDRKNRRKLVSAAISALDLCHYPENADEYVFLVGLKDTPGVKYRYQISFAGALSFDEYENVYGGRSGNPRNDQRIGQERAKAKSETCISFQIVEWSVSEGCRNTFQTWMMPKDMHGYRIAGFGVLNWEEILLAQCAWPKVPAPPIHAMYPKFSGNRLALEAWRQMYKNDICSAAIDALELVDDPLGGRSHILIIYLRCTGMRETLMKVENAFVFSLEEAETMLAQSVWRGVELVVNGKPRTESQAAKAPAPCVVCQIIDQEDPVHAPTFLVPVQVTPALLGQPRWPYSWKERLAEVIGDGDLRPNLVGVEATERLLYLL
ncbi:hypothetical protein FB45DRAFT_210762 [Roridomyces roridus]|uniref:MYND-type domain-containing protein n=1 Tax=Roridomyces roridus TaxID=1738132 RepID=A0AAD7CGA1_9AGAR|nr:hypothetical protein FB45DRAFT_210762 [Roridomyces roridus]